MVGRDRNLRGGRVDGPFGVGHGGNSGGDSDSDGAGAGDDDAFGGGGSGGSGFAAPAAGPRPWSADPLAGPLGHASASSRWPRVGEQALAALSPHRRAVQALAVVAAVVVVISAFLAWHSRPSTIPVEAVATTVTTASAGAAPVVPTGPDPTTPATATSAAMLVVAVEGKVRHPGLVRLPPGSRVADAIDAAGGAEPGTDLSFVNLAQKVVDGELIVIGVTPPPGVAATAGSDSSTAGAGAGGAASPGAPINLNSATEADLETLPGIGPALAQRIIAYRTQHGSFRSVDELRNVSGIGDAKFAEVKDLVTV
jgi:competence protein ComEA